MALPVPASQILEEALRSGPDETFEKALGRVIRSLGGTFADYVDVMSRVREKARADKIDVRAAARDLASHP